MSTTSRAPQYAAPALERGLDILELLATERDGLSPQQIAQRLARSSSQLFRMLTILERRGYLHRSADGQFRLSLRLFELAHRHPPTGQLLSTALPLMQALAGECRQSNHLVVHHDGRLLVVAQVNSPEPMGFGVRLGAHFAFLPDRASSRVLAAFQPPERSAALVAEMLALDRRRTARAALLRELARVRSKGYFQAASDTTGGVTDLCCPVLDHGGQAIAALTMPYLAQRDVTIGLVQARQQLLACARQVSQGLGWLP